MPVLVFLILGCILLVVAYFVYSIDQCSEKSDPMPTGRAPRKTLVKLCKEADCPPVDYVVIDTETTGVDACTEEVLEIAAIRYQNHQEVERFHRMIRPLGRISDESFLVHHIGWADVKNGVPIEQAVEDLREFIRQDVIVGYNVEFDIKFLQTRASRLLNPSVFDVLEFARAMRPGLGSYKLVDMKALYGIESTSHRAMEDCETTAAVYQELLKCPEAGAYKTRKQLETERLVQARVQAQMQRIEEERRRQQEVEDAKNRKKEQLAEGPSQKELKAASAVMEGTPTEYVWTVYEILKNNGRNYWDVKDDAREETAVIRIGGEPFFRVKLSGNLRYVVLDIPPETICSDYLVTPSSMTEGICSSRVFVPSPSALFDISEYVLKSYENANSKVSNSDTLR